MSLTLCDGNKQKEYNSYLVVLNKTKSTNYLYAGEDDSELVYMHRTSPRNVTHKMLLFV